MTKYHHKESDLQIRFVHTFRVTWPEYARLLEHPKNEGSGHSAQDRRKQAISKAEGVQAGVSDIIFHVPSESHYLNGEYQEEPYRFHSLAIEFKTKTGRQSPEQKLFQRYFEAAGGRYEIVRDYEHACKVASEYVNGIPYATAQRLRDLHEQIDKENLDAARSELDRIINK